MNYDSPKDISVFLKEQGIALKKKWGQNFLISGAARNAIISRLQPAASDFIWEIGPGLGAMTKPVLDSGAKLLAFEIDRGMIRSLEYFFGNFPNLTICEGDFVKTFEDTVLTLGEPTKIFGNLPYACASKIILVIIARKLKARTIIVTVQKELAQRMTSLPRKKSYSSFSVICQYAFDMETLTELSPHSFYPQPDVSSTVLVLAPRDRNPLPLDEDFFFALCRASFSSRRKTLANNITASGLVRFASKEALSRVFEKQGFVPGLRAEELQFGRFVSLSNALIEYSAGK
jgi:16S rRNA (adenine1518-N6/adenine1519-N6)-dimethyltransferase